MRPVRKLALKRERLTELSTDDLAAVAGANALLTLPVNHCLSIQECPISEHLRCLTSANCPSVIC